MRAFLLAEVVALGCAGLAVSASATPVLNISSGATSISGGNSTLGWSFRTNQALTVTALDAFDPSVSGAVRLYNAAGTVLASAVVTLGDTKEESNVSFYSHAISAIILAANTTYYIAQDAPTTTRAYTTSIVNTDLSITYIAGVFSAGLGGNPTTDASNGIYNNSFFGPNFDATPVPEPASLTLLGMGMGMGVVGIMAVRRRRAG